MGVNLGLSDSAFELLLERNYQRCEGVSHIFFDLREFITGSDLRRKSRLAACSVFPGYIYRLPYEDHTSTFGAV